MSEIRTITFDDLIVVPDVSEPTVVKWPRCWCGEPLKNSKVRIPAGTVVVQ